MSMTLIQQPGKEKLLILKTKTHSFLTSNISYRQPTNRPPTTRPNDHGPPTKRPPTSKKFEDQIKLKFISDITYDFK